MKVVLLKPGDEELLRRAELRPEDAEARRTRLKNLIKLGKERGFLTNAEINDHLPDEHQRKGVGRAMIDFLSKLSADRGYREMWVLTDLDNEAGNALYKSAGGHLENSPANMYVFPIAKR